MIRTLVPLVFCAALAGAAPAAHAQTDPARKPESAAAPSVVVNLNTATVQELQQLPGIGEKTAERIVEYRQKNGSFKKIEELMNVQGIGEKSFLKLRTQITVSARPAGAQQD
jgi:competence protein ComEA